MKIGKPNRMLASNKNPAIHGPIKFENSKSITKPAFAATIFPLENFLDNIASPIEYRA